MSEKPTIERQYDLDGNLLDDGPLDLDELDQGMEDVAFSSDGESDTSPPGSKALSLDEYHEYHRKALPASASNHADTFLGEKGSARDEFDALLAASEEEMVMNALLPDNEDYLTVLEKAYTAAEVKVENLCNQAANLLASRVKVEKCPEPQRPHAPAIADKALLENSTELEEAKSAALIALNRAKTLKATHRALLVAPALTAVPCDHVLPFHAVIKRYFKITDISMDPNTGGVHWVSISGLADKGAPMLDLESSLKKASADTLVTFVVRVVNAFLEQFEKYYKDKVGEMFPYLAWHYMVAALVPSNLQDLYADVIQLIPVAEHDWDYVNYSMVQN